MRRGDGVRTCNHDSAGRRPHRPAQREEVDVHRVDDRLEEERDLDAEDLGARTVSAGRRDMYVDMI